MTVNDQLVGDIIGGMIAFDQGVTNSLLDSAWGSAEDWAERYRALYSEIKAVNRDLRVDEVLHAYGPGDLRSIDHFRKMQGKEPKYQF